MATVTMRGAAGTTVTLTHLSDAAAPAAQALLAKVDGFVGFGLLDQFTWPGSGAVPTPSNLLGGVIVQGGGGNVGGLQAQYVSAVVDATGPSTVIGPANASTSVVAGGGGLVFLNLSKSAEVVLGGGGHGVFQARDGAGAHVTVDGALVAGAMDGIGGAAMTISALAGSLTLVGKHGDNAVMVQAADGAAIVTAVDAGGDAPATIQGGPGTGITHLAIGGGAFINPGAGNATVFGGMGTGNATVFGDTFEGHKGPAFTGSLTVVEGRGVFLGGSAGGNIMTTDTVTGAATLIGGGSGDVLISRAPDNVLIAGAGNETLSGFGVNPARGGAYFFSGGGNATIFGNSGGGNYFALGPGVSQIDGRDEAALAGASLGNGGANSYYVYAGSGGGHVVADFVPGLDRFLIGFTTTTSGQTLDTGTGLSFFTADDKSVGNPFAGSGHAGTLMTLSGGTKVYFYDAQVTATDLV